MQQNQKNFERADIQGPLNDAITAKIAEIGLTPTGDHVRRTIRSVLRIGAKIALENGCSPSSFLELCSEAFAKEAGPESVAPAPLVTPTK